MLLSAKTDFYRMECEQGSDIPSPVLYSVAEGQVPALPMLRSRGLSVDVTDGGSP